MGSVGEGGIGFVRTILTMVSVLCIFSSARAADILENPSFEAGGDAPPNPPETRTN